ncbi:MAG: TonB-dependent receptor [Pseudomonadales bacterium]
MMGRPKVRGVIGAIIWGGCMLPMGTLASSTADDPVVLEEIVVTARRQEETLRDAPVAITALGSDDLERYQSRTLEQVAAQLPDLTIHKASSGTHAGIFIRGIGSSASSAAFEQSVALNIDGVTSNLGRLLFDTYFDTQQVQVLKGPQSLYFGKSASAGVISVTSKDPGEEFEFEARAGYESEYDQTHLELILSGPVSDTLGARLAVSRAVREELYRSVLPRSALDPNHPLPGSTARSANEFFGEKVSAGRFTLLWTPVDAVSAKLKVALSEFESDGAIAGFENVCVEGTGQPQPSLRSGIVLPNVDDCAINSTTSVGDIHPAFLVDFPLAQKEGGRPYLDTETTFVSLTVDAALTPQLDLTVVGGYVEQDLLQAETTDFTTNGTGAQGHQHDDKTTSLEVRLASAYDGPLNFMAGLYYQDHEQTFRFSQNAVNVALVAGPDPITGRSYDWQKNQVVDSEVWSGFVAAYWDITPALQLTAGVRYTDETKKAVFEIPYMHAALQPPVFLPSGSVIEGLKFEDDNVSPEVSIRWKATDEVTLYAAYKTGFKSGGIDNSALPSTTLSPLNPEFPDFLIYDSEEAKGGEVGFRSLLLDRALQLNGTAYHYRYSDLQVQQLNASGAFQFETFNASEVTTQGVEVDAEWKSPVPGLSLRGAVVYLDAEYTDPFIDIRGDDLDGRALALAPEFSGSAGVTYTSSIPSLALGIQLGLDVRYSDEYRLEDRLEPLVQDSYWSYDAFARIESADEQWELALIGRNLTDKLYLLSAQDRVGAVPGPSGQQDRVGPVSRGREVVLQATFRM